MHERSRHIRQMFDRIAARYDLLNHLLSAGSDIYWRKAALDVLSASPDGIVLDLCAGTGDLALEAARRRGAPRLVVGVDLAQAMMRIGQIKAQRTSQRAVRFICGNAEELPFKQNRFDGAMVAFGVRNLADIPLGLSSILRVLRPGGRLVVLELSRPRLPLIRQGYQLYFRHLLPIIGGLISGDPGAYRYLHTSVMAFPERERFIELMEQAGFVRTGFRDLSLGVATLYWGEKV